MKFYLDEDLPAAIAQLLRQLGLDAVSAQELGHRGWSDQGQLAWATENGRAFVTRNVRDFLAISRQAVDKRQGHRGIVMCPPSVRGKEIASIAHALVRVHDRYPQGLGEYDVVFLER